MPFTPSPPEKRQLLQSSYIFRNDFESSVHNNSTEVPRWVLYFRLLYL